MASIVNDTSITQGLPDTYSASVNFECSGEKRMLVVTVSNNAKNAGMSATYNGVAMTKTVSTDSASVGLAMFTMVNPPEGTHTVTISGSGTYLKGYIVCLNEVDQTNPINTSGGYSKDGQTISNTITTTKNNCLIIDAVQSMSQFSTFAPQALGQTLLAIVSKNTGVMGHATSYLETTDVGDYTTEWYQPETGFTQLNICQIAFNTAPTMSPFPCSIY